MAGLGTLGSTGKLNGILNGRNGYHAASAGTNSPAAPPKAQQQPQGKVPRDRKAFRGVLIGGEKETRQTLADKLLDWYGIDVRGPHLDTEYKKSTKIGIPARTEVVVILTDSLPTGVLPKAIDAATQAGVPHVGVSRRSSTWPEPMRRAGFLSPPPWRGDADAGMVDASHDDEDEDIPAPKPQAAAAPQEAPAPLSFGRSLKAARIAGGLSREDLAGLVKIGPGTIEAYEFDACRPSAPVYARLRELFGDALPEITPKGWDKFLAEQKKEAAAAAPAPAPAPEPAPAPTVPAFVTTTSRPDPVVVKVPAPAPYVPPTRRDFHDDFHEVAHVHPEPPAPQPAAAPAPVSAPAAGQATIADYAAAVADVQNADRAIAEAQERRRAAVERMEAIHRAMMEGLKR